MRRKNLFFFIVLSLLSTFCFSLTVKPSLYSRLGWLLYNGSDSTSEYSYNEAQVEIEHEDVSVLARGIYLFGRAEHPGLDGKLNLGAVYTEFTYKNLFIRNEVMGWNVPDSLYFFNGIPNFMLEEGKGIGLISGAKYSFPYNVALETNLIYACNDFSSGDLYYFYGKFNNTELFGGDIILSLPYDFELFGLAGKFLTDIKTNEDDFLGGATINAYSIFVAKKFYLPTKEEFFIKPFIGYLNINYSADCTLTTKTQTYIFFPYKYVGGKIKQDLGCISTGVSLEYNRKGFKLSFDGVYGLVVQDSSNGIYAYKYKKSMFFDGSSDAGELDMPDFSLCHLFALKINLSYEIQIKKHFKLYIETGKMLGAVILTNRAEEFMNRSNSAKSNWDKLTGSSSNQNMPSTGYSSVTFSSSYGGKDVWEIVKKALFSGVYIGMRISF